MKPGSKCSGLLSSHDGEVIEVSVATASVELPGPVGAVRAEVSVPTSKSLTNRALIAAAVAEGGTIHSPLDCDDTRLLAAALSEAGWFLRWDSGISVGRRHRSLSRVNLQLGNSGTGARLILSLLTAVDVRAIVDGTARLRERPMRPLLQALVELGARLEAGHNDHLPVAVDGMSLKGGQLRISPGASSQFVTSLLLAAPLMEDGLDLQIDGPIPSRPYLDLTLQTLEDFGGTVNQFDEGRRWRVAGGGLTPTDLTIEGDWSAAPFMLGAAAIAGGRVTTSSLREDSRQGDRQVVQILQDSGLDIRFSGLQVIAEGPVTKPLNADLRDCPDLFPALAVVAAMAPPGSRITGLEHLRHKECDRLTVMVDNLRRIGASCEADQSTFTVTGAFVPPAAGNRPLVTAADDHRVAMAMAMAALVAGPLNLDDGRCVSKSFPDFWQQWSGLVASAGPTQDC